MENCNKRKFSEMKRSGMRRMATSGITDNFGFLLSVQNEVRVQRGEKCNVPTNEVRRVERKSLIKFSGGIHKYWKTPFNEEILSATVKASRI